MKYDLVLLLVPGIVVVLTILASLNRKCPKGLFASLLVLSIYLSVGIYCPAFFRLLSPRTHLSKVTITDEQGSPVEGVGVSLGHGYVIGHVDFARGTYREEAAISDSNGNAMITPHRKPLPILLIPFLTRLYNGSGYFIFKKGYYPEMGKVDMDRSEMVVIIKRAISDKTLHYQLDKIHYLQLGTRSSIDHKSAIAYNQIYSGIIEELSRLSPYDKDAYLLNYYMGSYNNFKEVNKDTLKYQ